MKKILVIEDDSKLRANISELLSIKNYTVIEAENGVEGISKAIFNKPNIILCDVMMPGVDGFEVLEKIKNNQELKNIPFIFLTAKSDRTDIRKGMALGADDYVTKPFSIQELVTTIEARLQRINSLEIEFQDKLAKLTEEIGRSSMHEFSTPLNSILGFSSLITQYIDKLSKEDIIKYSQIINDNGNRLKKILDNLVMFQKLNAKTLLEKGENLKLSLYFNNDFITDIVYQIASKYDRMQDIELDIEPSKILFQAEYLTKVLCEIIDNAFKFSKKNSKVQIKGKSINPTIYKITVIDMGIGFHNESPERIEAFKQFERAKYEQQGMGLGLYIANQLITIFGGKLEIQHLPQGTEVNIFINRVVV
ncbi:MAG: response regulator [Leptospiraceae bacterium]|nr:response regulator [Leptospiraceae bacterium]